MSMPEPQALPETTSESSSPLPTLNLVSVLQLVTLIGMALLIAATYNSIRVGIQRLETAVRIQRRALSEQRSPSVEDGTSTSGLPTPPEPTGTTTKVLPTVHVTTPYTEFFDLG